MWVYRLNGWTRCNSISAKGYRRATCRCLPTSRTLSNHAQSSFRKDNSCVVRFAPSPTGELHLGGLRTAIFNWLLARSSGGKFILRIEDTDKSREVIGADWDQGPLRQSDRLDIYQRHGQQLLDIGSAYRCFCPQVQALKPDAGKQIDRHGRCPSQECVHLSKEDVQHKLSTGTPFTIRLKCDLSASRTVQDLVYGSLHFGSQSKRPEMDPILIKTDGYPTYHLANVVDDHEMGVTHVLRGEEWISSLPKHLSIYEAFGWSPPKFVHLPILKSRDGLKLSKRTGSTSIEKYRTHGFEPEAIFNWAALMGWSNETSSVKRMMSKSDLLEQFTIGGINRAQVIVDEADLLALNKRHLSDKITKEGPGRREVVSRLRQELTEMGSVRGLPRSERLEDEYIIQVLLLMNTRLWKFGDIIGNGSYFFTTPRWSDRSAMKMARSIADNVLILESLLETFSGLSAWTLEDISSGISSIQASKTSTVLRWSLTATMSGPPIAQIAHLLGRGEVLSRLALSKSTLEESTSEEV